MSAANGRKTDLVYRKSFGPIPVKDAGPHRPSVAVLDALRDWDVRAARMRGRTIGSPERSFSLVRLSEGGGDWLLPDNDEKTLWRLRLYGEETRRGTVQRWGIWCWRFEIEEAPHRPPNVADEDEWKHVRGSLKSRAEAIKAALKEGAGESQQAA
jgi:hypothetical protein